MVNLMASFIMFYNNSRKYFKSLLVVSAISANFPFTINFAMDSAKPFTCSKFREGGIAMVFGSVKMLIIAGPINSLNTSFYKHFY
jgi:hypothetical protein